MRRRPEPDQRAVDLLVGHIDQAQRHVTAAVGAYTAEREASGRADDPETAGTHAGHADLASREWSRALGARAALEALHVDLTGRPSPAADDAARLLADFDLPPNPVGLGDLATACATAVPA